MPLQGDYMGMMLTIEDLDHENRDFFRYCAEGKFHLQQGATSGLLRRRPPSSRTMASARRAMAATTSPLEPSSSAADGPTIPPAAISARGTPTA